MQRLFRPRTCTHLEAMWAAGLTETQILHLVWLKQEVLEGKHSELTTEFKRRQFTLYLFEHGYLHED